MNATDLDTRLLASETWSKPLEKDAEQDLTPLESIQRWRGVSPATGVGGIPPDAELHTCGDLVELDQLLNPGLEPEEDRLSKLLQDPEHLYGRDWGPLIMNFSDSVDIELTIHHDIWFPHAFDGYPHPEVYGLNASRLTAALQQIESGLGQETEPGDGTFFGQPTQHGIFSPQRDLTNDPDLLDVTDISNVGWTFHELLWEE